MALVSKEEYLKRYLSGADYEEKKKKKKKKAKGVAVKHTGLRIVDDDIGLNDVAPRFDDPDDEPALYNDEGPTVVGLVDDRPEDVIEMEHFRETKRWKTLANDKARRHDSDSDASPQRATRHDSDSDQSPPNRQRYDSNSDASPQRRHDSGSDASPPRKKRHNSDSDASPPRRKKGNSDSDASPPRRKKNDSDSDASPPRRKKNDSDSDQAPDRQHHRSKRDSRKSSQRNSPESKSRRKKPSRFAPLEPAVVKVKDDKGRAKKTLSGLTAGLSTARAMRQENEAKRRREDYMFDMADEATLGKNAATVFRDKETGRKRNPAVEDEKTAAENARKEAMLAKYKEWGKGLAQKESHEAQLRDAMHEMDKPLARMTGDADMEALLRDQERDGDPMLAYMRKQKQKNAGPAKAQRPRYSGKQPPANRFNLWPGYRWDGVDRSNGFEKSFFLKISERKARDTDAYKWSIEDM